MDCEGAFIDALHTYVAKTQDFNYLKENMWAVHSIAKWTESSWKLDGTSLWEEREVGRHYVHSKVMCWVSMDRAAKMAQMLENNTEAAKWHAEADKIKKDILEKGISKTHGGFTKYYDGEETDSSLLLLPLYGFVDANDPVFSKTLRQIEKELITKEGLMIRYKSDMMGSIVNPFTLLNAWLARVYIKRGEIDKAKATIDTMLSYANDLLLFAEHVNAETREPLGNFPQLFPHAGLVQAILEYEDAVSSKK